MTTRDDKRAALLAECQRRGIRVEPAGSGFLLRGGGVDMHVARLEDVTIANLKPALRMSLHEAWRSR